MSTINAPDRWSHGACSACCIDDFDGDGFITREDLGSAHDAYCGNEDGNHIIAYLIFSIICYQIPSVQSKICNCLNLFSNHLQFTVCPIKSVVGEQI